MLVREGHEHLQIEHIQLDPGDKVAEGTLPFALHIHSHRQPSRDG
ncbi:hypothetical protein ACN1C3_12290 [Pseudomonas sp. H11T01]